MNNYTKSVKSKQNQNESGFFVASQKPYLTNINKSDSNTLQNSNTEWSESLLNDLNSPHRNLYVRQQNIKFKEINQNEVVAYKAPRPRLSIPDKFRNTGEFSSSESARFSARNRFINKIKANPELCYFFTGTFNGHLQNRYDAQKLQARLTKFLQRRGITYILVPEQHKDGAWHFHGLFDRNVLPYLQKFDLTKRLPKWITDGTKNGRDIYDFPDFQKTFGYVSVERVRSLDRVAVYVSKYLMKSFDHPDERAFYHRYFCSKGLKEPKVIQLSEFNYSDFKPTYLSPYCPKVVFRRAAAGVAHPPTELPLPLFSASRQRRQLE